MLLRHELKIPFTVILLLFLQGRSDACYANDVKSAQQIEQQEPSFYGARAVPQGGGYPHDQQNNIDKPLLNLQRRNIYPVIPEKKKLTYPVISTDKKIISHEDLVIAKKAKYYIERNWNAETGLIDSVQGYHHATLWDIASGIAAILALENLLLISQQDANSRLDKVLSTLANMPLYNDLLPNREYNTKTGLPSGTFSYSTSNGNGWSALDIGRLLIWLQITKHYKPEFGTLIDKIIQRWHLLRAIHNKTLYGELRTKKGTLYRQEGRLGYLQYAAQGYQFAGFDVTTAFTQENTATIVQDNTRLYIDKRNLPFFTSDSYVLQAIEIGHTDAWWNQLQTLYLLHQRHYNKTNQFWIFAEDAMSKPPWFAYNNINIQDEAWVSTTTSGKPVVNPQIFSNKVAFAFSVIFDDDFSQKLAKSVLTNSLSTQAIPTGLYQDGSINTAYNINTNSLILVSLWFKKRDNLPIYPASIQ